jgi:ABC-type branched-subunit amino acid transport system ATPase component
MLAFEPRVMLLDEPSAGLAQPEVGALGRLLAHVRAELRPAMLIVEHDLPLVMGLVDRVVVMSAGRVVADGPPADLGGPSGGSGVAVVTGGAAW